MVTFLMPDTAWLTRWPLLCTAPLLASCLGETVKVKQPEDFVNVLAGATGGESSGQHHSSGNTLPIVARPWGFNHWSPQTIDPKLSQSSWWFDGNADTFYGIRCTHQPSPWIGDYAWFLLQVYTSYQNPRMGFTSYHAEGAIKPHRLDLTLGPDGQRVELTPTNHGALLRVTFPQSLPVEQRKICAVIPRGNKKDKDEKGGLKSSIQTGSCRADGSAINLESRRFSDGVPGKLAFFARLEGSGLRVDESAPEHIDCAEADFQWLSGKNHEEHNMPGQDRSTEKNHVACQKRCSQAAGCVHFTYWPDGGCHLQDGKAERRKGDQLMSGPPSCPSQIEPYARECCFISSTDQAEVMIGTSFISSAQAQHALQSEVKSWSFSDLAETGKAAWRRLLRRVEVIDAGPPTAATFRRLEVFYTSLYRVLLFPRRLDENTPDGVFHWSPYNGELVAGIGVTDNGFWDTFRTVYPLLAIAYPEELGEIVNGWLMAFKAGGWLPKWASPGYRDSMVGTFADVVVADAIIKNISGFDKSLAWEALHKDAHEAFTYDSSRGKKGLEHYTEKGFIPIDVGISEACSRTLDFAFADAATAAAAVSLGKLEEAEVLRGRSKRALKELYDYNTGLMGHRKKNQNFVQEAPETWGDCYTEGSAWHHSFPPFDLDTLSELHGGAENLLAKLHSLFTVPAAFKPGSYKNEIHEMREMRMLGMGQYAHNNQPTHHLAYLFAMLGDHNTTAKLVRQILFRAYSPEGFAGDEDNGEMGAWYVLSALGLYAPAVGVSADYVLGAVPLFPRVRLHDLDITIEAPSASETAPHVRQVAWKASALPKAAISYSKLRRGGVLLFVAPGDTRFGRVYSALRGSIHQVARRSREIAEKAVSESSGLRPPSMLVGDDILPVPDNVLSNLKHNGLPPRAADLQDEEDTGMSTTSLVLLLLVTCMGCFVCFRKAFVAQKPKQAD